VPLTLLIVVRCIPKAAKEQDRLLLRKQQDAQQGQLDALLKKEAKPFQQTFLDAESQFWTAKKRCPTFEEKLTIYQALKRAELKQSAAMDLEGAIDALEGKHYDAYLKEIDTATFELMEGGEEDELPVQTKLTIAVKWATAQVCASTASPPSRWSRNTSVSQGSARLLFVHLTAGPCARACFLLLCRTNLIESCGRAKMCWMSKTA